MPWREYSPRQGQRLRWGLSRTHNLFFFFFFWEMGLCLAWPGLSASLQRIQKKVLRGFVSLSSPPCLWCTEVWKTQTRKRSWETAAWSLLLLETKKRGTLRWKLQIVKTNATNLFSSKVNFPIYWIEWLWHWIYLSVFHFIYFGHLTGGDCVCFTLLSIST